MSAIERLLADPYGRHDAEAAELNLRLRTGPVAGKLVLVVLGPARFALARLPVGRHAPVEFVGPEYPSVLEGERDILRRRFEAAA